MQSNKTMPDSLQSRYRKILSAQNIVKRFPVKAGGFSSSAMYVHALNSVSFDIYENSTLGLVGESGSGKTTTARTILRVHEPDSGRLFFNLPDKLMQGEPDTEASDEHDFFKYDRIKLKKERTGMQYIFQDPYLALNPKMEIGDIITEPASSAKKMTREERDKLAKHLLDIVGITSASFSKFPHEFSGGQRQRISIARSISVNPKLIICDEPVSSLDVSIQSQILNLLIELQRESGISYLFIAHNLAVVFYMSDFVAVMYAGRIVEYSSSRELYDNPLHPYTQLLRSVVPEIGKGKKIYDKKAQGEVPSLVNLPPGCPFYNRCIKRIDDICDKVLPPLVKVSDNGGPSGHLCACHAVRRCSHLS